VQGLSAAFPAGVHLIVGPNGVGKTSLLNAIAGTLPLSAGRMQIDGAALTSGSRDVILAPNAPPEIPWIRAGLLLDFIVSLYPATRRSPAAAAVIVERLGISRFLDSPLGTLSAGSARKLMLASALIAAPRVMLFDEPTNETDAASIAAFVDMAGEIATRSIVIITTHHAKDLESLAPSVVALN
jgi:ABC-type multidrug transport system ATPase subunit